MSSSLVGAQRLALDVAGAGLVRRHAKDDPVADRDSSLPFTFVIIFESIALNHFVFDAELEPNDRALVDAVPLPATAASFLDRIEHASQNGNINAVEGTLPRFRQLVPKDTKGLTAAPCYWRWINGIAR
nr:hypothetical protein CFP56_36209 [Quercus suber]